MTPAPVNTPMYLPTGQMAPVWSQWFAALAAEFAALQAQIKALTIH